MLLWPVNNPPEAAILQPMGRGQHNPNPHTLEEKRPHVMGEGGAVELGWELQNLGSGPGDWMFGIEVPLPLWVIILTRSHGVPTPFLTEPAPPHPRASIPPSPTHCC